MLWGLLWDLAGACKGSCERKEGSECAVSSLGCCGHREHGFGVVLESSQAPTDQRRQRCNRYVARVTDVFLGQAES